MHKLFCIIGRTGSGKSTLVKKAANELGLKILKSYTTRPMRESESYLSLLMRWANIEMIWSRIQNV